MNKHSKQLKHSLLIKLSDEDRKKVSFLQNIGFNVTQLFRIMIQKEYEKNKDL